MKKLILILFVMLINSSCKIDQGKIEVKFREQAAKLNFSIANVKVENNEFIINGENLSGVENIAVNDQSSSSNKLVITSKTNSRIVAQASGPLTLATKQIYNLVLSNSLASATYTIDFNLCDSKLGTKAIDCTVAPQDGYVLTYDLVSDKWKPKSMNSLTYMGTFDASSGTAPTLRPAGSYFVISVAGTISTIQFDVGDWIISNGTAYQKIDNSNSVSTVFGRLGAVTAQEGDYNIDKLADVDLTVAPTNGQALVYDTATSKWKAGTVASGGGGGPWGSGDITDGSIASADIADGTITGTDIAANTITLDKLNGTSDATKYLRGDKTWADLRPDVLATPLTGLSAGTGSVAATDTILQAMGKLLSVPSDYVSKTSGASITAGTVAFSGTSLLTVPVATGATPTEVTNVQYVQQYVDNAFSSGGAYAPSTLTTVNGAHSSADTTLTVASTSGYPSTGTLLIGNEVISYSGKTATTFTGLTRGAFGTTAASISNGATVNNILIMARTTTSSTPNFVVTGSGNVGISTSTPLDVLSFGTTPIASATRSLINLSNTALSGGNVNGTYIGANPATKNADFVNFQIGGVSKFNIDAGGSVTIQPSWGGGKVNLAIKGTPGGNWGNMSISGTGGASHKWVLGSDWASSKFVIADDTGATTPFVLEGSAPNDSLRVTSVGNVGIGMLNPTAKLHVAGQIASATYNNGSSLTFDMNNGNNQYTSASCAASTLNNVVDGATYTIAVQGATSGTCTFTATGYTFRFYPANGATTANSHSIYSMQVMGSIIYVSWITGF